MDLLKIRAASFIQVCHNTEARMSRMVLEAQHITATERRIKRETQSGIHCGIGVAAALALLCLLAGPVTNDWSIFVYGTVAAYGSFVAVCFILFKKLLELSNANKMTTLVVEFSVFLDPLKSSLEEVKISCENLSSESAQDEALRFTRLEVNILQIFFIIEKLRNSSSLISVTQQAELVKKVADEFGRMKIDLKTFY